ncbi:cylicin-2-like [Daphnia pulicaria]|uniref:cylicin-2-like n=1 Tax=Daphnia pulicaria TaxID=35523 RepID=UPI001EEA6C2B|nr:cylicin-2-like [Daphnia pulicaria]
MDSDSGRKGRRAETSRFFLALRMHGTVFDFMVQHLPGRSRNDVYRKFKLEEKKNPEYVDQMLRARIPFDPTLFEPNGDVIDTVVAKGKKGRGKKPGKKEVVEENHLNRVEAAAPAPVAETKEKRGRGKKAQPRVAKSEEMSSSPEVNPEPVEETAQEKDVQVWVFKVVAEPKSKPGPKSKTGPKSKMETKPTEAESETTQVVEPEVVEKKGRGKRGNQVLDTAPPTVTEVVTDQPEVQAPPVVAAATEVSPAPEVKKGRGKVKATVEEVPEPKESENLVTNEPDTKEKRGRGRQASSKDGTEKAAKASEEPLPNDETESPLPASPVAETKEKRGRGPQAKAQAEAPVEETTEAVEVVPAKRGRGKKAAAPAASKADAEEEAVEEVDAEEEAVEEVKEAKAKGKKGAAAAKKHVEEEVEKPAVPEEPAAPVKTVVESPETSKAVPAKRGRRKKATPLAKVAGDEEAEAVAKVKETKAKGKKGPAAKKQAEKKVAEKKGVVKKDDKATELPLRVVNGLEEDSETNPSKRSKTSEDAEAAAEEPEKKAGRGQRQARRKRGSY